MLRAASFTLTYDPTLLTIASSGALTPSPDATAAGLTTVTYTPPTIVDAHHWTITVHMSGGTGFTTPAISQSNPTGTDQLVLITATVPNTASYKDKSMLSVSNVVVNGTSAAGVSGVEVAAYLGDIAGTGVANAGDASIVSQVGAGAGTGFNAFKDLDPSIIAGVDGSLNVNATDASLINEAGSGESVSQIPAIPSGFSLTVGGPDPYLYLSAVQGSAG